MANGHGGYRRPSKPAVVSGPGRLSKRTDGGPSQGGVPLPNAKYGENANFQSIERGAPMAADAGVPAPVPLTAPTARPHEPVTAGAVLGPGPGPGAAQTMAQRSVSDVLQMVAENDPTGQVGDIAALARRSGI